MDKTRLVILLFLVQLTFSLGIITREYHYVNLVKTWAQAQNYCRENFVDLATTETAEDWTIVRAMMQSNGGNAWIGLYDDYLSWRWSINDTFLYKDGYSTLGTWLSLNADNYGSVEHCGQLHLGSLYDCTCTEVKKSVCYDELTNMYIPVTTSMDWASAQSYCRKKYTDLTSIRNQQEYEKIMSVIDQSDWWVGLFRYGWVWSDNSNSSFRQWNINQPVGGLGRCAQVQTGGFVDVPCASTLPFICSIPIMKLVTIVMKTEAQVQDPQVQEGLLSSIHKQMRDNGISQNFQIRWRKQPNGQIFVKEEAEQKVDWPCPREEEFMQTALLKTAGTPYV